jgi:hypothetical protein
MLISYTPLKGILIDEKLPPLKSPKTALSLPFVWEVEDLHSWSPELQCLAKRRAKEEMEANL